MRRYLNILFIVIITMGFFSYSSKQVSAQEEKITSGVYIDDIDIGGMTPSEANEAVNQYVEGLKGKTITIKVEEDTEELNLEELGLKYKDHDYLEQAIQIGKTGNLMKRYKEIKDIANDKITYPLEFELDSSKIEEFVETRLTEYNTPAKNASLKLEGGKFHYFDEQVGKQIEKDETIKKIEESINEEWNKEDILLNAVITPDQPKYTRQMVEKVNSKLGSFTTNYSSSTVDRSLNLDHGARLINNTVLYPGEEFSAYDKLAPFTIANGYTVGGAYAGGKVVDSIGGGICQVTTTLYNAVLYSELEVTERANHSMTISYTDLSRDAAIAGTWKNLRFANNTEHPVLIQAYTKNRNITFTIWGHETRPSSRKIEYETVVLSQKDPPKDVVTEDPTKPVTYEKVTQSAHKGYVAELYKVVYENGKQVSRTRINRSQYQATPRYITKGTMPEPSPTPTPTPDPEPTKPVEKPENVTPTPDPSTGTDPSAELEPPEKPTPPETKDNEKED